MSDPYLATINLFALTYAPAGYLYCQGQLLQISEYQAMFSLLSTNFGGDGRATFGLPDLQGRVPLGQGNGAGLTPRLLAQKGGDETQVLTQAEMPNHSHQAIADAAANVTVQPVFTASSTLNASTSNANASTPDPSEVLGSGFANGGPIGIYSGPNNLVNLDSASVTTNLSQVTDTEISVSVDVSLDSTGGNGDFSIMPPFLVLPYCIAVEGIYPPRPN